MCVWIRLSIKAVRSPLWGQALSFLFSPPSFLPDVLLCSSEGSVVLELVSSGAGSAVVMFQRVVLISIRFLYRLWCSLSSAVLLVGWNTLMYDAMLHQIWILYPSMLERHRPDMQEMSADVSCREKVTISDTASAVWSCYLFPPVSAPITSNVSTCLVTWDL